MEIIEETPWHFALFKERGSLFITYMIGNDLNEPVTIELNSSEIEALEAGSVQAAQLAERFRRHRHKYRQREIDLLNVPQLAPNQVQ